MSSFYTPEAGVLLLQVPPSRAARASWAKKTGKMTLKELRHGKIFFTFPAENKKARRFVGSYVPSGSLPDAVSATTPTTAAAGRPAATRLKCR